MSKRIMHLFMVFVIGFCLSLPLPASANAEVGADGTTPVNTPAEQCPATTPKDATSPTVADSETQTTDDQTPESTGNDCNDWQIAPVSWNS